MEIPPQMKVELLRNMFLSTVMGSYKGLKEIYGEEGVEFLKQAHVNGVTHQLEHQGKGMPMGEGLEGFKNYLMAMDSALGFEHVIEERSEKEFVVKCTACPFVRFANRMGVGPEFCSDISNTAMEAEIKLFFENFTTEHNSTLLGLDESCEWVVKLE